MNHHFELYRFVNAQLTSYDRALSEIRSGKKRSHWMWFIFPQMKGLGTSQAAELYGIENLEEAAAYLQHPVLGNRLLEISKALLELPVNNATAILGTPDDLKLCSSMTLFALIPGADPVFQLILNKFYKGMPDAKTLLLLH